MLPRIRPVSTGRHRQEGPHLGMKQAKSWEKRALPLKGPLSGVEML